MTEMRQIEAQTHAVPDADACWDAFLRRDRSFDGRFVGAVLTTGIYCKPSCAARHPRRENMIFLADPEAARAAGFRACLRCRPDEVGRDRLAVEAAVTSSPRPKPRLRWKRWRRMRAIRRIISTGFSGGKWA
jgi:AraC family transcriptional regulator, regulatory protein of adaptative response / methylated-DNA-[protein]-cysteine methyltransferase